MKEKLKPLDAPMKKQMPYMAKLATFVGGLIVGSLLLSSFLISAGDQLSQHEHSKIIESMKNIPVISLQLVADDELDLALATMPLNKTSKNELNKVLNKPRSQQINEKQAGKSKLVLEDDPRLVWVDFWDFASQDGDVIEVSSAGYSVQVNLLNTPNRIAVPVDMSYVIYVNGVVDGGGGITLGVNAAYSQHLVIEQGSSFPLAVKF